MDEYVDAYPSGVNVVNYATRAGNPADATKLAGYVGYLQGIDPRVHSRSEQMAYWINLYNAVTVNVVLGAYPLESIEQIHEGVVPLTGLWSDVHANLAGKDLPSIRSNTAFCAQSGGTSGFTKGLTAPPMAARI